MCETPEQKLIRMRIHMMDLLLREVMVYIDMLLLI